MSDAKLKVEGMVTPLFHVVIFNTQHPKMSKDLRKALSLAIDRKMLNEALWGGKAVVPQGALRECLTAGVLCNDAVLAEREGRREVAGDPTEGALLVAAERAGWCRASCMPLIRAMTRFPSTRATSTWPPCMAISSM